MNSCNTNNKSNKHTIYKKFLKGYIILLVAWASPILISIVSDYHKLDEWALFGLVGPCILIIIQFILGQLSNKYNWKKSTDIVNNIIMTIIYLVVTLGSVAVASNIVYLNRHFLDELFDNKI